LVSGFKVSSKIEIGIGIEIDCCDHAVDCNVKALFCFFVGHV
jgi:hypothetical protein